MKKVRTLRETIQFYLIDCNTIPGKLIDIAIMLINLLVCAIFVLETYNLSENYNDILFILEAITVIFFIVEYIARLYGARNRLKHVVNIFSIIDLVAILPGISLVYNVNIGILRILRVFRIFRIFRFLRFTQDEKFFFGSITKHFLKVVRLILTILIIFFVGSGLFWTVEHGVNPGVNNFGDAFYFTVVALTTVGFGDIIPASQLGRAVTVLMIISGIILIPWQASLIVREWFLIQNKKNIVCKKCGLKYHDKDASHCKACGHVIYQEYEGG